MCNSRSLVFQLVSPLTFIPLSYLVVDVSTPPAQAAADVQQDTLRLLYRRVPEGLWHPGPCLSAPECYYFDPFLALFPHVSGAKSISAPIKQQEAAVGRNLGLSD